MRRRQFISASAAAGAAVALGGVQPVSASEAEPDAHSGGVSAFRLRYAPNFGTFREHAGADPIDNLRFMSSEGFTALEDNGMRGRPVEVQQRIGRELERLGMSMGVFVAHTINWTEPTLTSGRAEHRDRFLAEIGNSVDIAQRVNARWMTVVPGHVDPRLDVDYQTAHLVESLKRAAAILEPHDLVMVLEPLNTRINHPGMFLTHIAQIYLICKAVASPACKILYDIYHQQITEGNLIPNFEHAWDEIAYIQVGDNPGRNEPGTGEINYRNVFRHLHTKGYAGIVGMEHGKSRPGREGERAVIEAYREADGF